MQTFSVSAQGLVAALGGKLRWCEENGTLQWAVLVEEREAAVGGRGGAEGCMRKLHWDRI